MRLPHLSIRSISAALIIIAFDCVLVRSIWARPNFALGIATGFLVATVPMANLVALVLAGLMETVGRRSRLFRAGFALGALLMLGLTTGKMYEYMGLLEYTVGNFPALVEWINASERNTGIALVLLLGVPPFLAQLAVGWVGGWILSRTLGSREPESTPEQPRAKAWGLRALLILAVLASIPNVIVELWLFQKVDQPLQRRPTGMVATIQLTDPLGTTPLLPPNSILNDLNGQQVVVEADNELSLPEKWALPQGGEFLTDRRLVKVRVMKGEHANKTVAVGYYLLKPLPDASKH